MNENIDLTKILNDCPRGWELYTPIFGKVKFEEIRNKYGIRFKTEYGFISFSKQGYYYNTKNAECLIFPSKEQRDWNKFKAPWYNKKKFDKQKNNVHFYVARDLNDSLRLYIGIPHRKGCSFTTAIPDNYINLNDKTVCKYFGLNKDDYNNLKWEDEPIEVFVNTEK